MAKFDDVNIGRGTIPEQITRFRRQLAQQIEELVKEGEAKPQMTVGQLIALLKK